MKCFTFTTHRYHSYSSKNRSSKVCFWSHLENDWKRWYEFCICFFFLYSLGMYVLHKIYFPSSFFFHHQITIIINIFFYYGIHFSRNSFHTHTKHFLCSKTFFFLEKNACVSFWEMEIVLIRELIVIIISILAIMVIKCWRNESLKQWIPCK